MLWEEGEFFHKQCRRRNAGLLETIRIFAGSLEYDILLKHGFGLGHISESREVSRSCRRVPRYC